jgi:hypothetical protein
VTISGNQWPGAYGGSVPLQQSDTRGSGAGGDRSARAGDASQTGPEIFEQRRRIAVDRCADARDRREHFVEVVRIGADHLCAAAQVVERVGDIIHVDRAHCAQVLGDHHLRIEFAQRARVQVVEIFAGGNPLPDERVDLTRCQPLRQRCRRHDPPAPRSRRIVALEGHADHVVTGAQREADLGRRRQQRDDTHPLTLVENPVSGRYGVSSVTGPIVSRCQPGKGFPAFDLWAGSRRHRETSVQLDWFFGLP